MKTTLDLPDPILRDVKIKAAREGRKMKEVVAELLVKGLENPARIPHSQPDSPAFDIEPTTGFPVIRCQIPHEEKPPSTRRFFSLVEQTMETEDLSRAGISDR